MATRVYNVLMLGIFMAFLATSSLAVSPSITYTSGAGVMGESYPCCDTCSCTRSIPPQCRCTDIKTCPTAKPCCHSSCKNCGCTRSIPPKCWCSDIKNYCDAPCPSEALLLKTAVVKDY